MDIGKFLRTLQVEFPFLLEWKFAWMKVWRSLTRTPFEYEFNAIPLLSLPANALFLDIGANRVQSIEAIIMMHPGAKIEAFEPNPDLFQVLKRQFQSNGQVDVHNYGLGDVEMVADLCVPFYKR